VVAFIFRVRQFTSKLELLECWTEDDVSTMLRNVDISRSTRYNITEDLNLKKTGTWNGIWNCSKLSLISTPKTIYSRHYDTAATKPLRLSSVSTLRVSAFIVRKVRENMKNESLGKWPTWCTITLYNTFIIIILYMFRATLCSSSGQIVLYSIRYSILCKWPSGVHTRRSLTENTIPDVLIQFDLLMMSTELLETCRGL